MLHEPTARSQLVLTHSWSLLTVVFREQKLRNPSRSINIRSSCSEYEIVLPWFQWLHIIISGVITMGSYNRKAWYNLSCLLQANCHLSTVATLSVSWLSWTGTKKGSGRRKNSGNCGLEFANTSDSAIKSYRKFTKNLPLQFRFFQFTDTQYAKSYIKFSKTKFIFQNVSIPLLD